MSLFVQTAIAAEEVLDVPYDGGGLAGLVPLLLVFTVFYFLILRPQIKKQKEHQEMLDALVTGERVIFAGGMLGTITKIDDDEGVVQVEITKAVRVMALKSSIVDILEKKSKASNPKEKKKQLTNPTPV